MKTALKTEVVETPAAPEEIVKSRYLEALHLVERLHRRLLDVIKDEFERRGRDDVNSVQALLLYNIGDKELTASELRTRGYYLGSNVSYNVKKLVEMGYLHHARSRVDRRSVRISLTDRGRQVHDVVQTLYDKHARTIEPIGGISHGDFERLNQSLIRLERFWTDQIRYRL
jgi:DNA-binding MarR family transcriptional regulator